jgi:hypothetical protein
MLSSTPWPRVLLITGLVCMVVGAVDPLEGSIVILLGTGLATLAAFLAKSHRLGFFVWSFALVVVGVGVMFSLSAFGGLGGGTGRSLWWGVVVLPYPVGWVMGLVGAVRWLLTWHRPTVPSPPPVA